MVTFECPWCAEALAVETSSLTAFVCERCLISVDIAADPIPELLDRAA